MKSKFRSAKKKIHSGDVTSYDVRVATLQASYESSAERWSVLAERLTTLITLYDESLFAADEALFFLQNGHHRSRRIRWTSGDGWYSFRPFIAGWQKRGTTNVFSRLKSGYGARNLPTNFLRPETREITIDLLSKAEEVMSWRRQVVDALRILLMRTSSYETHSAPDAVALLRLARSVTADERFQHAEYLAEREAAILTELELSPNLSNPPQGNTQ